MPLSLAGMAGLAESLQPALRAVQDVAAIGSMFPGAGGRQTHGAPFGAGQDAGGPGLMGIGTKIGWNLTGGKAMRLAGDVGALGLSFAGDKTQQAVGQDMIATGERTMDKAMNVIANPVSIKNWTALGAEIATLVPTIANWGKALLQNVDALAQFDANMARTSAKMQIGELRRTMRSADVTGESAEALGESLELLLDDLQPIKDAITIVLNTAAKTLVDVARKILVYMEALYETAKSMLVFAAAVAEWVDMTGGYEMLFKSMLSALRDIEKSVSAPKESENKSVAFLRQLDDRISRPDPALAAGIPPVPFTRPR